jgi:hypothetical protein
MSLGRAYLSAPGNSVTRDGEPFQEPCRAYLEEVRDGQEQGGLVDPSLIAAIAVLIRRLFWESSIGRVLSLSLAPIFQLESL